jgi:hypothetical protein
MMLQILEKQGFHPKVVNFFKCYLVGRTTHFKWGEAVSPLQNVNVGVGQGSALSPVLTNLYIAPILFKCDPVDSSAPLADKSSLFFYVDDGLLVATSPSCTENVPILREKYQVICRELERIGLRLEHDKTELMHFHQKTTTVLPGIDLGLAPFHNGRLLMPSKVWRYLGFYFTLRLRWDYHIKYYATRARSSVQAMLMLGNSIRGLTPMISDPQGYLDPLRVKGKGPQVTGTGHEFSIFRNPQTREAGTSDSTGTCRVTLFVVSIFRADTVHYLSSEYTVSSHF